MTKYFDRETGRTFFVGQGIGGCPGQPWFTLYQKGAGPGTHRLKTKALPYRSTRKDAQADLDTYARKKGWEEVQTEDPGPGQSIGEEDETKKLDIKKHCTSISRDICPSYTGLTVKTKSYCKGCEYWRDIDVAQNAETVPQNSQFSIKNEEIVSEISGSGYELVPIYSVYPNPNNPRKRFDQEALDKLTESIRQVGILEPLLVVEGEDKISCGRYRIVAGERRYRAALAAGLQKVPVIVRELTEEQEFEAMLTENIQRQDLDPIEEAQAFQAALARGWKQTELAEKLGISQAQVANRLRLLKLPDQVQDLISHEILSAGHGLALVKVAAAPELVKEIVKEFQDYGTPVARASDCVDREIRSWGKPLYSGIWDAPKFDHQAICIASKCKYRVHATTPSYESGQVSEQEHPYCIKPECWERHQKEAIDAEREAKMAEIRAKAQAAGQETEQVELPKLKDLDFNSYEKFTNYSDIKIDECTGCEKIVDALGYKDEVVQICTDQTCWKKKIQEKTREKARETRDRKKVFDETIQGILQASKSYSQPPKHLLTYMAVMALCEPIRSSSWTHEKVWKAAYKFFGWPGEEYPGWHHEAGIKDLLNNLEKMDQGELWQVVLFGLLRGIDPDERVFQFTVGVQEIQEPCA